MNYKNRDHNLVIEQLMAKGNLNGADLHRSDYGIYETLEGKDWVKISWKFGSKEIMCVSRTKKFEDLFMY